MLKIKSYYMSSDQGPYLEINEDAVQVDLRNKIYSIYDGFGGAGIGDSVVNIAKKSIDSFCVKMSSDPDSTLPFSFNHKFLIEGNAIINAVLHAHNEVTRFNNEREISSKGGVSTIVCSLAEKILTFVSVGNCRACLLRNGHMTNLVNSDSLYLSSNQYDRMFKTASMNGLGLFEDLYYEVKEFVIEKGDLVVLLTDGVYGRLLDEEMKYILNNTTQVPEAASSSLI